MKKQSDKPTHIADVIIVGAGVAGLTLACLTARVGVRTLVLDATNPQTLRQGSRTVALLRPALSVLAQVGINAEALTDTARMERLRLIDAGPPPYEATFVAREIGVENFGLNIRNDALHAALLAQAQTLPSLRLVAPAHVQSLAVTPAFIDVTTDCGLFRAPLLVGADGRNSVVRTLCGITARHIDYGQSAITCVVSHPRPHHQTSTEFHRPGGPFTLVPLSGNRSSVVWLETTARAQTLMDMAANDFAVALQAESHDVLGSLEVIEPPQSWPITLTHARELTRPRVALVAEAAHALPPSGAQGLNLSLRDVAALAPLIIEGRALGLDIGGEPLLRHYRTQRRGDILARVTAVDGLNRLILAEQPIVRWGRRQGLALAAGFAPMRHALMRFGWAAGSASEKEVRDGDR